MRKLLGLVGAAAVVGALWWWTRRRAQSGRGAAAPTDLRFMYAMHNAFRRDLARLERAVANPESSRGGWEVFREELEFHHRAEDDDLWPALRARTNGPADQRVIDNMVAEHARVPPALDAVARAFDGAGELEPAVDGLAQLVRDHLDHEEGFALPIVRQQFSDADWHDYLRTERRKRGRKGAQFLCWVLDDADAADAAAVLREVPPPGRVAYRRILKPRYDARHLWSPEANRGAAPLRSVPV
jgi:hemerythrin HHE cation binding domain-containing protein